MKQTALVFELGQTFIVFGRYILSLGRRLLLVGHGCSSVWSMIRTGESIVWGHTKVASGPAGGAQELYSRNPRNPLRAPGRQTHCWPKVRQPCGQTPDELADLGPANFAGVRSTPEGAIGCALR